MFGNFDFDRHVHFQRDAYIISLRYLAAELLALAICVLFRCP